MALSRLLAAAALLVARSASAATLASSRAQGMTPDAGSLLFRESSQEEVLLVSSLGGTVPLPRRARVMDAALGTEMSRDVAADAVVGSAVDAEFSVGVIDCGTTGTEVEAASFAAASSQLVVLHVWRSDLGRCLAANANALRALRDSCRGAAKKIGLVVCVHEANDGVASSFAANMDAAVSQEVKAACDGDVSFCSSVVGAEPGADGLGAAVRDFLSGSGSKRTISKSQADTVLNAAWTASRSPVSERDAAVFQADAAFARCKEIAESALQRWKRDVDDGRLAPKGWAADAAETYRDCLAKYDAATLTYWQEPARSLRRAALDEFLYDETRKCHLKQLELATAKRLRKLRFKLEHACAADPRGELDAKKADELVSDAEFAFDADATRCTVPSLDLNANDFRLRFRDAAKRLAADFPDTPAAQLFAAKAEERAAKRKAPKSKLTAGPKTPKPKKPVAFNYAVQLVGMLRPKGFGNMQAFCNYAIGPHSILFGYSDDRDVAGDMANTFDDIPFLRLQPKFTLDLDV